MTRTRNSFTAAGAWAGLLAAMCSGCGGSSPEPAPRPAVAHDAAELAEAPGLQGSESKLEPRGKVTDLTTDGTRLYWIQPMGLLRWIMRQEIGSEQRTKLREAKGSAWDLVADRSGVYWSDEAGVHRMGLDGRGVQTLDSTSTLTTELHLDATHVYMERAEASIWRVPKSGGDIEAIVEPGKDEDPFGEIAVDRTHIYWAALFSGELRRKPKSGGPTEVLYKAALEQNLMLRSENVLVEENRYQAEQRFVIVEVPKAGGAPKIVAEAPHRIVGLAATSDRVALISNPCKKTPCEPGLHARLLVYQGGARVKEFAARSSFRSVVAVGDEFWWTPKGHSVVGPI